MVGAVSTRLIIAVGNRLIIVPLYEKSLLTSHCKDLTMIIQTRERATRTRTIALDNSQDYKNTRFLFKSIIHNQRERLSIYTKRETNEHKHNTRKDVISFLICT